MHSIRSAKFDLLIICIKMFFKYVTYINNSHCIGSERRRIFV